MLPSFGPPLPRPPASLIASSRSTDDPRLITDGERPSSPRVLGLTLLREMDGAGRFGPVRGIFSLEASCSASVSSGGMGLESEVRWRSQMRRASARKISS